MIDGLESDAVFMKKYGQNIPVINQEFNYLLCLSSLANKENKKAVGYFKNFVIGHTSNLVSQRTLVFVKKYVSNLG